MSTLKARAIKLWLLYVQINSVNTLMKKITMTTIMTGFTILCPLDVKLWLPR